MISVVIPTLNEEKYIERTLISLKNQSYKEKYEIIVADGMSTDGTVEIAKKYTDNVVKVGKKGIAAGRNAGAKLAKDDIILFVDADTRLKEDALYRIDNEFKDASVAIVSGKVSPDSTSIKNNLYYGFFFLLSKLSSYTRIPLLPGYLIACRRKAFEHSGGFDEKLVSGEDLNFSGRLGKYGKCKVINDDIATTSPRRIESLGMRYYLYSYFDTYIKSNMGTGGYYAEVR